MLIARAHTAPRRARAPDARLADLLEQVNRPEVKNAPPTPTLARESFAAMTRALAGEDAHVAVVRDAWLPSKTVALPVRLYDPDPGQALPVCLYLHGGGHMAGSVAVYDPLCRRLAATARCRVVALEYRLAPEHPYPQGLDDCARALAQLPAWLAQQGIATPGGLTVVGDSGGGALTASVCALAATRDDLPIARQILIYPSLDYTLATTRQSASLAVHGEVKRGSPHTEPKAPLTCGGEAPTARSEFFTPSIVENASGYLLEVARVRWYFDQYFQHGEDRKTASPLFMSAAKLPPTLLFTAGFCPLRDEAYAYAHRLRRAGTPCTHQHLPAMIHAFMNLYTLVPDACDAVYQAIGRFIR